MITPAQRAEIRRLYYAEHWKIGTIAAQLGLHRETVRAAVERESPSVPPSVWRSSIIDPYLPFIRDTLTQYPRLRATRIHEMVRQRGYAGSVFPVRKLVRRLRPETSRAVYRRVVTLAGESAQVDWGSFGKVRIGQGTRTVSGFVMVLGYSRALAALFTLDQTLESFLRGHVAAFDASMDGSKPAICGRLKTGHFRRPETGVEIYFTASSVGKVFAGALALAVTPEASGQLDSLQYRQIQIADLLEQLRGRGPGRRFRQRVPPLPVLFLQLQERLHGVVPLLWPRSPVRWPTVPDPGFAGLAPLPVTCLPLGVGQRHTAMLHRYVTDQRGAVGRAIEAQAWRHPPLGCHRHRCTRAGWSATACAR